MFWSMLLNSGLAFAMVIIVLLCLGPVNPVASASYPMVAVILNATGSVPATTAICCGLLLTVIFSSMGSVASASRLTWAWARDGALPSYFAYVTPNFRVPIRSVWLPCIIVMLLSLLNFATYTAFSVVVALSTFGLYQSYCIAIACMLHARLTGRIGQAPWSLGRAGPFINAFALLYSAWVGLFMIFVSLLLCTSFRLALTDLPTFKADLLACHCKLLQLRVSHPCISKMLPADRSTNMYHPPVSQLTPSSGLLLLSVGLLMAKRNGRDWTARLSTRLWQMETATPKIKSWVRRNRVHICGL